MFKIEVRADGKATLYRKVQGWVFKQWQGEGTYKTRWEAERAMRQYYVCPPPPPRPQPPVSPQAITSITHYDETGRVYAPYQALGTW